MKEIELSNGMKTQIDDGDYEYLNQFVWHYKNGYVHRNLKTDGRWTTRTMHRDVVKSDCQSIDHADGNGLNNQTSNLREATQSQNSMNRKTENITGFKGVSIARACVTKPYRAMIRTKGKRYHLGYFTTPNEAAKAYDEAATKYFGEFALLNFPKEEIKNG